VSGANYLHNSEWRAYFPKVFYSPTPDWLLC
jgi:hypothetical protein